jgi:predicted outer membrane repeat protein
MTWTSPFSGKYSAVFCPALVLLLNTSPGLSQAAVIEVCQPPASCGHQSIQAAIDAAADNDEIVVYPGTYLEKINFSGSTPTGPKAITIRSTDPRDPEVVANTVIDGDESGTVVTFNTGETALSVLKGFTITNGTGTQVSSNYYGGGIFCRNSASPTIESCIIRNNNNTKGMGGGIASLFAGGATLRDCTIINNTAKYDGGISVGPSSTLIISDSRIQDNTAVWRAGGIGSRSSVTINNCDISRNKTQYGRGGGIYAWSMSTLSISASNIKENTAEEGGGISGDDSSVLMISDCTIQYNTAKENGGGIYCGSATISNSTIRENTAGKAGTPCYGGGIYGPSATISHCIVTGNTVIGNIARGGGIYGGPVIEYSTINDNVAAGTQANYGGGVHSGGRLSGCRIENNSASAGIGYGGGIYEASVIENCSIKNNTASVNGGGIHAIAGGSNTSVTGSTIINNAALTGRGGGIFGPTWYRGVIANTNISGNRADTGAGVFCSECAPAILNCTIIRNAADTEGGAIYGSGNYTSIRMVNTILWENEINGSPNEISLAFDASLNGSSSIIMGGWPGDDIIDADPLFADVSDPDPVLWDLHLTSLSPAIDRGDDTAFSLSEPVDIDGDPRFLDGNGDDLVNIDIGSDEYDPCPADFDHDGDVDGSDLAEYSNKYITLGRIDVARFATAFGRSCYP